MQPIFEEKKLTYIEKEIYKIINKGVADFTNDYMERFYKYLFVMPIRNYDASLPFEFLMERASDKDRDVFSCCYFEDDIFLEMEKLNYQIGGRTIVFSKKAENIFLKIKKIEMLID